MFRNNSGARFALGAGGVIQVSLRAAGVLLILCCVPAAQAETSTSDPAASTSAVHAAKSKADKLHGWSFQIELTGRWDDNITELSDTDRSRVGDPNYADRFKIQTVDDWIVSPSARAEWSHEPASHFGTSVRFDVRASLYKRNSIKNFEIYDLRIAQDLSPAKKYTTRLVVRGGYTPDTYLRELSVPQATLDNQGLTVRDSARYSDAPYSFAVEQVLAPKQLELTVQVGNKKRNYDMPFDERDGDLTDYQGRLDWAPLADRKFSLQFGYRVGSYDAAGDRAETPALEPDISSDRRALMAGGDVRWGNRERRGFVSLDALREARDFTSDNPADTDYFDRNDTLLEVRVTVHQAIRGDLYLEGGLYHKRNSSNLGSGASTSGTDDVTDYTRNVISFWCGWRY